MNAMDDVRPVDPRELDKALEIVRAAYSEAMRKCGMLSGKIIEVTAVAEVLVTEVLATDDGPESEATQ
jgi:predicted DNA-binding protein (UPF0278 family)